MAARAIRTLSCCRAILAHPGRGEPVDVEYLALFSGSNTTFGDVAGNTYSYDITTVDANVTGARAQGQRVFLDAGENLTFDGSAETDSYFLVYASSGTDDLTGGRGMTVSSSKARGSVRATRSTAVPATTFSFFAGSPG
jgi:hypothetical protein